MALSLRDLIQLRAAAGLTQAELAQKMGLARTAISKIEHGDREITFVEAIRWAELCGASVVILGPGQDEAMRLLGQLGGRRLGAALRVLFALGDLEEPHLATLELLLDGWNRLSLAPEAATASSPDGVVKKL